MRTHHNDGVGGAGQGADQVGTARVFDGLLGKMFRVAAGFAEQPLECLLSLGIVAPNSASRA
jgi:hypothetical protein